MRREPTNVRRNPRNGEAGAETARAGVGVLRSSKETPEIGVERRRGSSCADAFQADREPGDGPQGIETPALPETATGAWKLQRTLYRQAEEQAESGEAHEATR